MSDGFPESLNDQGEMLDYPRIREIFQEFAEGSSNDIADHLFAAGDKWMNGRNPEDDITFVIFKYRE